ncbi:MULTISPECIES: PKD-like family lipoprotein [Butyricimonas]|uniref:Bacteroidetes PKD-like domain-containing protein n=1 Tax=Butyricimonas hominis TaxID=2763032 RepID=A0ABR7CW42_9BACT|nr:MULTISPECIES: PKD-like family lipoprotein [Butyricimonas]MBC5619852.1 hypothetical protein [Butyricimonas hominis]MCB6973529.1 hypothetical protein [Butyricimonas synergistica]MCG4520367.1 PKD-like family lipoprotein [Butyricimonas sp. DFI.6.44]
MKKIYIWILSLSVLILGCMDDKGNYSYSELNKITIDNIAWSNSINYGDPLNITPELSFSLDSVNVSLSYEWIVNGVVIDSTSPELHIESFKEFVGNRRCYFRVEDNSTGMKYTAEFMVNVSGTYQAGWLILSEKDNKSYLSYVKEQKKEDDDGNLIEIVYGEETDVYKNVNGTDLGSEPIKLLEHWSSNYSSIGEILVLQKSGSVELDGSALTKAVDTELEFLGETYPANFVPKDALYPEICGYLLSEDGNVYSRRNDVPKEYHSGRFMAEPMRASGGMRISHFIPTLYLNSKCILMFDELNHRYLACMDTDYEPKLCGEPTVISHKDYPDDFSDLNNMTREIVFAASYENPDPWADYENSVFSILYDRTENQYYMQNFGIGAVWYTGAINIAPDYEIPFPDGDMLNGNNVFAISRKTPYFFFSAGANQEKLYWRDMNDKTGKAHLFDIDFEGHSITSIAVAMNGDRIGVGLDNGIFYLIDATDVGIWKSNVLYKTKNDMGKIKHVIFKSGARSVFMWGEE